MSNVGQAALGIVGGVVGWFIGGPQGAYYGFQIGYGIGTIVSPTQLPGIEGPRLNDVRTTTSQVGGPVMEVYGADAVPGQVMWLGPVQEVATTEEVGGKGAPEQDVTTYTYFQSIAIGICRGPKTGIRRIWENGKLVYDARNRQEGESDEDYEERVLASNEYEQTFVFYPGSEDQEPDPTIELDKGIGNVPAFRGLCYIVYPDRQLLDEQGKRHPNFKFEVAPPAEQAAFENTILELRFEGEDGSTTIVDDSEWQHEVEAVGTAQLSIDRFMCGVSALRVGEPGHLEVGHATVFDFGSHDFTIECWLFADKGSIQAGTLFMKKGFTTLYPCVLSWTEGGSVGANGAVGFGTPWAPGTTAYSISSPPNVLKPRTWHHIALVRHGAVFTLYVDGIGYADVGNPAASPPIVPGTFIHALASNNEPVRLFNLGSSWASDVVYIDDFVWTRSAKYTSNFIPQGCAEADDGRVSIADIITDRCSLVGLSESYIDVSDLEDEIIPGYVISRVMPERGAIEPLRLVGFFDIVESGRQLKFVKRGKAPVRTLTSEDIGAYEYGQQPGPLVATTKAQDVDLPRQIRVHYRALSRDYEDGEQLSPTRLTTTAVNDVDVEIPITLEDDKAAQCAEVLWSDQWASRWRHQLSVDIAHADLEPADCILVPIDGRMERLRIVTDSGAVPNLRTIDAVRDDDGSYVSFAVADPPNRPPSIVIRNNDTLLYLLDLPPLRDEDDNAGIYAAACRTGVGNHWGGAVILRSLDGGSSFTQLAAVTNEATTGTVVTPPDVGDWYTWDDANEIIVELETGSLSSRTDEDVIDGANAIAMGAHGRWHIVQFANAEQISQTQWRLTRLLQGRRGTEHLIGTVQEGDSFVLISGLGIVRLPLTNSDIGVEGIYKAVTLGTSAAAGVDTNFTGEGEALKPFSPVHLAGERDSGGITITWVRRNRLGQELPSGTDIPMSESSLEYEIDILSEDSEREVLRTLEATTESVLYTAADIMDDFGEIPDQIFVRVYQMSSVVGRGTPAEGYV